jgi:hypothetical protein
MSEDQQLKCIDDCEDREFLEGTLRNDHIQIASEEALENELSGIFDKSCIKIVSLWDRKNSASLLK